MKFITRLAAALVFGAIAGCGDMPMQSTAATAPATAPVRMAPSVPTLAGGYQKVAAPAGAALYFINLKNGDTVSSPVLVQFGLRGIGVAPAGIEKAGTGHHHLLVDVAEIDINTALAMTDNIRHFGGGQSEARVELKPGTHTLQLLLAYHHRIPHHTTILSERITVTVK